MAVMWVGWDWLGWVNSSGTTATEGNTDRASASRAEIQVVSENTGKPSVSAVVLSQIAHVLPQ